MLCGQSAGRTPNHEPGASIPGPDLCAKATYERAMGVSRRESGVGASIRAYGSQIHPVFMLPPVATSLFGALLAPSMVLLDSTVHALAIFFAVYTAHVKDGYVDFHVRGEDDDHPLTVRGCLLGLAGATGGYVLCLLYLGVAVDVGAAAITLPAWLLGFLHAPQLDTNPVTATAGYPVGIGLAVAGGNYVQVGTVEPVALAFAGVFVVLLCGVKVIDDATDYEYDRSIDKHTVAVVLGRDRARRFAYGLMAVALGLVVFLTALGPFPPSSIGAVAAFALVAVLTRDADPELATMILIRGSYVFLALLVVATWYRPLS